VVSTRCEKFSTADRS
jgi:Uncharacterised protein family (UPF0093)